MENYKLIKINFIFFIMIISLFNYNNRLLKKSKKNEKNINICICTIGKKENKYIREFVEYYVNYGVDKIFLYDNNDKEGERFEDVLNDFIKNKFVEILNWRGRKREQLNVFKHCYNNNFKKFDWLLFYDLDEYIYLRNYTNIKDFLKEKKFNDCQIIYLNWIIHTDNNLIHYYNETLHKRFPILEPKARKNITFFSPVKSILKGHIPNISINCLHKLNSKMKACNGFGLKPKLLSYEMEADSTYYYIDHFYFKSLEEFIDKLNKGNARTYIDRGIDFLRINRYFTMNEINIYKLKYLENNTKINISLFKNRLKYISKKSQNNSF